MSTLGLQEHQGAAWSDIPGERHPSRIAEFYQDRAVFVTGGTGFIGKVLIEKLLRSCPGVKEVYILVRNKRGQEGKERLHKFLLSKVFDRLKREQPDALGKVRAVVGDLTEPNLGLSWADLAALIENVSVVFHAAATVKFDEPLKKAFRINVFGTRHVLDLCKQMPDCCVLVHVSTAYCNCDKKEVHEVVYPKPELPPEISEHAQCIDGKTADSSSGCLLANHPNTYTFTKALAESLLLEERASLPVAIVRPSIVTAAWKEPFPGWVDNYNGSTGIITAGALGMLHSMFGEKDCLADHIPVDVVATTLICAAWHITTKRPESEYVKVYHCTSGELNPQTWGQLIATVKKSSVQYPLPNTMSFPWLRTTNRRLLHNLSLFFLHYLPSCAGDLIMMSMGRKSGLVPTYHKIQKSIVAVEHFTSYGWHFKTDNLLELLRDLSPTDKLVFNPDVRELQWEMYWDQYVLGIRRYLFHADDSELPQARRRVRMLFAVHSVLQLLLVVFFWRILWSQAARNLYYSLLKIAIWLYRASLKIFL